MKRELSTYCIDTDAVVTRSRTYTKDDTVTMLFEHDFEYPTEKWTETIRFDIVPDSPKKYRVAVTETFGLNETTHKFGYGYSNDDSRYVLSEKALIDFIETTLNSKCKWNNWR